MFGFKNGWKNSAVKNGNCFFRSMFLRACFLKLVEIERATFPSTASLVFFLGGMVPLRFRIVFLIRLYLFLGFAFRKSRKKT